MQQAVYLLGHLSPWFLDFISKNVILASQCCTPRKLPNELSMLGRQVIAFRSSAFWEDLPMASEEHRVRYRMMFWVGNPGQLLG